jgi:hypothetical protein
MQEDLASVIFTKVSKIKKGKVDVLLDLNEYM